MQDHNDLALLIEAVRAAGAIALKYFCADYKSWNKAGGSPVTEADLAVDGFLCETLRAARPDYGWLSEETPEDPARLSHASFFVVDPIDGTVAFLKGRPHFTICAAVVREGRPCCGVVFNPAIDDLYAARQGAGATRNGEPIRTGSRQALEGCAMLGTRPQLTSPPWPPMRVENRNSVAYRLVLVADGSVDASVSLTAKRDWDLAAADIILAEAGARLTDAAGNGLRYDRPGAVQPSLVAANPGLQAQIIALLRQ